MVWLIGQQSEQLCAQHDHTSQVPQNSEALEGDRPKVSCACTRGLLACARPGSWHLMVREVHGAVQGWHAMGTLLLASWPVGCGSVPSHWHENVPAAV